MTQQISTVLNSGRTSVRQFAGLRGLVDDYYTCEFATMTKTGVPVSWPAVPLVNPDDGTITLTTSIAAPRKAYNIRRDPRVALLFSDPTGSGRDDLPQVLVQGTAVCLDEIHHSPAGLEEYWARQYRRQPASKANGANALARRLMDVYYLRLVITVTPFSVEMLSPLPPAKMGPRRRPAPARLSPYAQLADQLPGFASAVLSWAQETEAPVLQRVRLTADPTHQRLLVTSLGGARPPAGPASLLLHRHDDQMWNLRQCGAIGRVVEDRGQLVFEPQRTISGPPFGAGPWAMLQSLLQMRRTGQDYLDRRHLPRPAVAWDDFKRLQPRANS